MEDVLKSDENYVMAKGGIFSLGSLPPYKYTMMTTCHSTMMVRSIDTQKVLSLSQNFQIVGT